MVEHAGHDRVVGIARRVVRAVEAVRRLVDAAAVGMERAAGPLHRRRGVGKFLHAERGHDAEVVGVGNVQTVLALGIIQRRQAAAAAVIRVGHGGAVRISHLRQVTGGVVGVVRGTPGVVRHFGQPAAAVGQVCDRLKRSRIRAAAAVDVHDDLHEPVAGRTLDRLPRAAAAAVRCVVGEIDRVAVVVRDGDQVAVVEHPRVVLVHVRHGIDRIAAAGGLDDLQAEAVLVLIGVGCRLAEVMLGAVLVVVDQIRLVADLALHHRLLRRELPADTDLHGRVVTGVNTARLVIGKFDAGGGAIIDVAQRIGCRLQREGDIRTVERELVRKIMDREVSGFSRRCLLIGIVALQPDRVAVVHREIWAVVVVAAADQVCRAALCIAIECLQEHAAAAARVALVLLLVPRHDRARDVPRSIFVQCAFAKFLEIQHLVADRRRAGIYLVPGHPGCAADRCGPLVCLDRQRSARCRAADRVRGEKARMIHCQLCPDRNTVARKLRQVRELNIYLADTVGRPGMIPNILICRIRSSGIGGCITDERRQNVALVVQQDCRVERHGVGTLRRVHPLRVRLHGQQITARDALELVGGVLQ